MKRRITFQTLLLSIVSRNFVVLHGFTIAPQTAILYETRIRGIASSAVRLFASTAPQGGGDRTKEPAAAPPRTPAPIFNGKRVLPAKIVFNGLKEGHQVAAVYAVLNSQYQRGTEGWDCVEHVGVTQHLSDTLQKHLERHGSSKVAHVRALSFSFPQPNAMQDVAQTWRQQAIDAGNVDLSKSAPQWEIDIIDYLFEDDDDDDDDDDWEFEMTADAMASMSNGAASSSTLPTSVAVEAQPETSKEEESKDSGNVISPFAKGESVTTTSSTDSSDAIGDDDGNENEIAFTKENVDAILDEVRPYLIADGGNVSVERVDPETRNVYLKLEGACGSCPSSTVTMQMGIERVLKENYDNLGQVLQVEDDANGGGKPTELTSDAVGDELKRLQPAITAMGGVCKLIDIDATTGVVTLEFRGSNKVKQGLELALLDVPFVNRVEFVMNE